MDTDLITKSAPLQLQKFEAKTGELSAIVTTFGNKDLVGDIMDTKALDAWLEKDLEVKMLFQHDRNEIIGRWTSFEKTAEGVIGHGVIYEDVTKGADVLALIRHGDLGAVSIGFKSSDYEKNEEGGRTFKSIELMEVSVVDAPCNPLAQITSAKNEEGQIDLRKLEKAMRDAGLSSTEAKTIISGGKKALIESRDVIDEEQKAHDVVAQLKQLLGDI